MTVYELLSESGLEGFYAEGSAPGVRMDGQFGEKYGYLAEPKIEEMLLLYRDDQQCKVRLHLPNIHCSSCLWLLEHLSRLNPGVIASRVDFAKRQALITFDPVKMSIRELAELLHRIGYPPQIDLSVAEQSDVKRSDHSLILKIGITGFLFGNIMLLSFPEYLSTGFDLVESYSGFFSYLILVLSIPVLFYGAKDFFSSSLATLGHGRLTIDVPIAIGITVIFLRSLYEILSSTGAGYLDSMSGLVFFLLIGRWYQSKIYDRLSFERDFRSFFPLSVLRKTSNGSANVPVMELEVDDQIEILSQGVIPADCTLQCDEIEVDYSFVTGESRPVLIQKGEAIYAGGRNLSGRKQLKVNKIVSQSYLTELWNQEAFLKKSTSLSMVLDRLSGRFTLAVLSIAFLTGIYWYLMNPALLMDAVTAVLIVACPCALALSVPFALGNARRILSKKGLFTKNTQTLEQMAQVDTIVFDKTGTLTHRSGTSCSYKGNALDKEQKTAIASLVAQSAHPHSRMIEALLGRSDMRVEAFKEIEGQGISGLVQGMRVKVGSVDFVEATPAHRARSASWVSVDGKVLGHYEMSRDLREGVGRLIHDLRGQFNLVLLSGDNDAEIEGLLPFFLKQELHFQQSPKDKLDYIRALQSEGGKVMMIGDGLNDAGALQQADVGIALADDVSQFTPACDAILQGRSLRQLPQLIAYSMHGLKAVKWSVAFSLLYNIVGVSFAVQGLLTPLVAAILMPLSSVTVVGFATLLTSWGANRIFIDADEKETRIESAKKELEAQELSYGVG
jgi:Cu+-exporting ATPase